MRCMKALLLVSLLTLVLAGCNQGSTAWHSATPDPTAPPVVPPPPPPGPSDTTPPTTPTGLTATAQGEARIDLSWNASTDNVAVASYRVDRCQGVSCTNFAPLATPATTSLIDTSSLAGSTTYRYRVQAVDTSNLASSFSSVVSATTAAPSGGGLAVGTLIHDGPATPEQISLFLPVTGALPQTATATVRYKPSASATFITGHPMYRIRPSLAEVPGVGTVPDAFAWPIIDLQPGTQYDVEVTVNDGATTVVKTLTHTTRALPGPAGTPNKTIPAGASAATIQNTFDGLVPGDVLQFANGTYNVSGLTLNVSGTQAQPIYIRGQSRTGVVLQNPGRVLLIVDASHVVLENMTFQGSGVDSSINASSEGINFFGSSTTPTQTRITVRNMVITGVDVGIKAHQEIQEFLAYNNTMVGNNTWTPGLIDTNATWNDDGINIPGFGNCAFNNTLRGFGDNFAVDTQQLSTDSVGIHFYRNNVTMGGDDGFEGDGGHRNITFYDNRLRNTMTFLSLDPLFGGPLVAARNVVINTGRTPFKWNSQNAGQFVYNNTVVRTLAKYAVVDGLPTAEAGWYQANNGGQNSYGYRNNILVYRGNNNPLQTIRLDNSGHNPIDFTHNSWFPNAIFQWPSGSFSSLSQAFNGLSATTPVFSGSTKRHDQDNITVTNPWTTTITLGVDYHTEVTTLYTPVLAPGTAPKNSGVVIPNITDGFSGGAPDRGAVIEGRPLPAIGDPNATIPQ
jgi:hypothetical protein